MGFFYRKSVNLGPFRVNLSGSGVGYSVGGRGFRVGKSSRGRRYTAFSVPGTGVGYRGSVMGMVTLIDLMETIVGDVPSMEEQMAMPVRQREDGSWLIDGLFEIEKLPERLEGFVLPEGGGDEFQTVSGWLVKELGRIPAEADRVSAGEWTFEVIDMDSIRVDKVLAVRHAMPSADVVGE